MRVCMRDARMGVPRLFPHLPFVRQTRLELLSRVLGVLDVNELLVNRCGIIKRGLPASVYAGDRRPDAHRAPEVVGHVQRHHVFDADAEVGRTFDLRAAEQGSETGNTSNATSIFWV